MTREEVRSVLSHVRVLRHRACLTLIYCCGLRLHETTNIAPADIDSKRMMVHIKAGKGRRDRLVPVLQSTLLILRAHYKKHRNKIFIFPAPGSDNKTGKTRIVTVAVLEFIRRFLQHVLPHNL